MSHNYRDDFPLIKNNDTIYIDNAATSQKPECVIKAEAEFYEKNNANPLRGFYPLSLAATKEYEDSREVVREFLNADSTKEIIFTRNTTESLNLVAYSYALNNLKAGDRASAPSIHMMKANIITEVSPIVGSEKQSEELVMYLLRDFEENPGKIWESNIFGKSLHELVNEGLHNKLYRMPVDARLKLHVSIISTNGRIIRFSLCR